MVCRHTFSSLKHYAHVSLFVSFTSCKPKRPTRAIYYTRRINHAGIVDATGTVQQCLASAKRKAEQWRRCKVLIVDEISMMDAEYFEKVRGF